MTTRKQVSIIVKGLAEGSRYLTQTPSSPTGYSWETIVNAKDNETLPGMPATLFEVAMWELLEEYRKKIELLKDYIRDDKEV